MIVNCDIDLGDGHTLDWLGWSPDRELNPHYADVPDIAQGEHWGATIQHTTADGRLCEGGITFDTLTFVCWQVHSWEPLTISPSLACHCGEHGFIREGKWVRA